MKTLLLIPLALFMLTANGCVTRVQTRYPARTQVRVVHPVPVQPAPVRVIVR